MGEAVQQHQLTYHAPAYYHKRLTDSTDIHIEFISHWNDFSNEAQPASYTADRVVDTYLFDFPDGPGQFDRELAHLELSLGVSMALLEEGTYLTDSTSMPDGIPIKGQCALARGQTKNGVAVYLRELPRIPQTAKPRLQVLFFKGEDERKVRDRVQHAA